MTRLFKAPSGKRVCGHTIAPRFVLEIGDLGGNFVALLAELIPLSGPISTRHCMGESIFSRRRSACRRWLPGARLSARRLGNFSLELRNLVAIHAALFLGPDASAFAGLVGRWSSGKWKSPGPHATGYVVVVHTFLPEAARARGIGSCRLRRIARLGRFGVLGFQTAAGAAPGTRKRSSTGRGITHLVKTARDVSAPFWLLHGKITGFGHRFALANSFCTSIKASFGGQHDGNGWLPPPGVRRMKRRICGLRNRTGSA